MAIPDYQSLLLPLLRVAATRDAWTFRDAVEQLADEFQITDEERRQRIPSGSGFLFDNRVGWARTYLKQAGLIASPRRGLFHATDQGKALLAEGLTKIDLDVLRRYPDFLAFQGRRKQQTDAARESGSLATPGAANDLTPEDELAEIYKGLHEALVQELLDQVKSMPPAFFERLVVDLLVKMGYGGFRADAGHVVGKSGDEGIDGVINEDKLGLDAVYLQAKRWQGVVGRPEIQKFAGALHGQRASKGVFITTSSFTREAHEYVRTVNLRVVLIDGGELASLMVEHNVGVSTVGTYEIKRIDSDYFEGE